MDPGQFDKQGFSSMWFQYELQRSIIEMYVPIQIFYPVFASLTAGRKISWQNIVFSREGVNITNLSREGTGGIRLPISISCNTSKLPN